MSPIIENAIPALDAPLAPDSVPMNTGSTGIMIVGPICTSITSSSVETSILDPNSSPRLLNTARGARLVSLSGLWNLSLTNRSTIRPADNARAPVMKKVARKPRASATRPPSTGPAVKPRKLADWTTPTANGARCLGAIPDANAMMVTQVPATSPKTTRRAMS